MMIMTIPLSRSMDSIRRDLLVVRLAVGSGALSVADIDSAVFGTVKIAIRGEGLVYQIVKRR